MDGGYYMLYDKMTPPTVVGGRRRADTAVRDQHGRFMPVDIELWDDWQLDPEHGRKAGVARASIAKRDSKGKFLS